MTRRLQFTLPSLAVLAPLAIDGLSLRPERGDGPLRVGEHGVLELTIGWRCGGDATRGAGEHADTRVEIEVQHAAAAHWTIVGPHRTFLSLPATLRWHVVPRVSGHLLLPMLAAWRVHSLPNGTTARGSQLPPPLYPRGGSVAVLPREGRWSAH